MPSSIQHQVKLPLSAAVEVVMQGIRIRFGRSVVTILGVAFGIAFLMATMTSQLVRRGVAEEEALRTTVSRMASFLRAETGLIRGRAYGLVVCGDLSRQEARFLRELSAAGARAFRWAGAETTQLPALPGDIPVQRVSVEQVGRQAEAILVLGDGPLPQAPWDEVLAGTEEAVLAFSRRPENVPALGEGMAVMLERTPKPEEVERMREERRRDAFRTRWIVLISLLVTVIGISNAMLMSVTERFREIGTMKCLGALSAFIRRVFLIESSFMGLVGGLLGAIAGALFSVMMYGVAYGLPTVVGTLQPAALLLYVAGAVLGGIGLSVAAAVYPATVAARMVPSDALRSNV